MYAVMMYPSLGQWINSCTVAVQALFCMAAVAQRQCLQSTFSHGIPLVAKYGAEACVLVILRINIS